MKRGILIQISLLLLVFIQLVSAVPELNFQNEEIQVDETILATIITVGEFSSEILKEDIIFLEGRRETFFEFDIAFSEGTHYLYDLLLTQKEKGKVPTIKS